MAVFRSLLRPALVFFIALMCALVVTASPVQQRRGLYVSVHTDHVGQVVLQGVDELNHFAYMMGDGDAATSPKVGALLSHLNRHNYTAISLYNMWAVLGDAALTANFRALMKRLRSEVPTLTSVEGISDQTLRMWERYAIYQNASTSEAEMFDGFYTEIEFWNGQSSDAELLSVLETMQDVYRPMSRISGVPLTYTVYIGSRVANETLLETMVNSSRIDNFYVAVYVDTPSSANNALNNADRTVQKLKAAAEKRAVGEGGYHLGIGVILSAEGTRYSAGPEYFMGEWLEAKASSLSPQQSALAAAEEEVSALWAAPLGSAVQFMGWQWYEYVFTGAYLDEGPSATTTAAIVSAAGDSKTIVIAILVSALVWFSLS